MHLAGSAIQVLSVFENGDGQTSVCHRTKNTDRAWSIGNVFMPFLLGIIFYFILKDFLIGKTNSFTDQLCQTNSKRTLHW